MRPRRKDLLKRIDDLIADLQESDANAEKFARRYEVTKRAWRSACQRGIALQEALDSMPEATPSAPLPTWVVDSERPVCAHVQGWCSKEADHDGDHYYRSW